MNDEIIAALAQALRSYPCRCDFLRNKRGVPVWVESEGGGIDRQLIRQCGRCRTLAAYDAELANRPPIVDERSDAVEPGDVLPI